MTDPFQIVVGDRLKLLAVRLLDGTDPKDLTGLTVKFLLRNSAGQAIVDEVTANVSVQPTTAFTADALTYRLTSVDHQLQDGYQVWLSNTGGVLPTGLSASKRYFVRDSSRHTFRLAETEDGSAIRFTSSGTGTHSFAILGSCRYAWQADDVATAGSFRGWFIVDSSGSRSTYPNDSLGIPIEIKSNAT